MCLQRFFCCTCTKDTDDVVQQPDDDHHIGFWNIKSCRLYTTILFGLAVLSNALMTTTLNMAMVCMVNDTAVDELEDDGSFIVSYLSHNGTEIPCLANNHDSEYEGPFVWNSKQQGLLFSAIYIGGLVTVLPIGFLSDRFNPKALVTVGLMTNSIGCCLTPIAAYKGDFAAVFALRFIMGFFGPAVIATSISSISARWIPPSERSTVLALYTSGQQIANIIGMPLNAYICRLKQYLGGWPLIFYTHGLFGVVSCLLWMVVVSNTPEKNQCITDHEKEFVAQSLSNQNLIQRRDVLKNFPWKKMVTSAVLFTLILCNFTNGFLVVVLMTSLPTYFQEVFLLDLKENGIFCALPFIAKWLAKLIFSIMADVLKKKTHISHTLITKIFNTLGTIGASAFLIACAYANCDTVILALIYLVFANGLFSAMTPGWMTSMVSIAPAYTGIIGAIGKFAGQVGFVLAPLVVSLIRVEIKGIAYEWRIVFCLTAAMLSFSGFLFILFGSATIQPWATQPERLIETEDNMSRNEIINDCDDEER